MRRTAHSVEPFDGDLHTMEVASGTVDNKIANPVVSLGYGCYVVASAS